MGGIAQIDLGHFRKRPPMMFEGEWRAIRVMKILKKENIWLIKYKEYITADQMRINDINRITPIFDAERRYRNRMGYIEIKWEQK